MRVNKRNALTYDVTFQGRGPDEQIDEGIGVDDIIKNSLSMHRELLGNLLNDRDDITEDADLHVKKSVMKTESINWNDLNFDFLPDTAANKFKSTLKVLNAVDDSFTYSEFPIKKKGLSLAFKFQSYEEGSVFPFVLPSRLASAILSLPSDIKHFMESKVFPTFSPLNSAMLLSLHRIRKEMDDKLKLETKKYVINDLTSHIKVAEKIGRSAKSTDIRMMLNLSVDMASKDLSVSMGTQKSITVSDLKIDSFVGFIDLIKLIRINLCLYTSKSESYEDSHHEKTHNYRFSTNKEQVAIISDSETKPTFFVLICGNIYALHTVSDATTHILNSTHIDFLYTYSNVMVNCGFLDTSESNLIARMILGDFREILLTDSDHNEKVNWAKSFEAYCLNISELFESNNYPVGALLDAISSMTSFHRSIHEMSQKDHIDVTVRGSKSAHFKNTCPCCSIYDRILNSPPESQMEYSALHKFLFYAVGDEIAGVMKEFKRIGTKRPSDPRTIESLRYMFRRNFILGFMRKEGKLPNFKCESSLRLHLVHILKSQRYQDIKNIPLEKFQSVQFNKAIESVELLQGLPFAKNKKALKKEKTLSVKDSVEEIRAFISEPSVTVTLHDYSNTSIPKQIRSLMTPSLDRPMSDNEIEKLLKIEDGEFKTFLRLIGKEREQKIELRLFGNQPIEQKYELALLNESAKRVLKYFYGQILTQDNKERQKIMSSLREEITEGGKVSIMLDIEGHNKSMQFENTSFIFQEMADILGTPEIAGYAKYFWSKRCYYDMKYIDMSIILTSQFGGVEGWMNPIWTLHNCLITSYVSHKLFNDTESFAVYSDDNCMVVDKECIDKDRPQDTLNSVIRINRDSGCIVKISQTVISDKKITILRNHSILNTVCDTHLKRLLSVMIFNRSDVHDDVLEIESSLSSISSTLEHSNTYRDSLILKWFNVVYLSFGGFVSTLVNSSEFIDSFSHLGPTYNKLRHLLNEVHVYREEWLYYARCGKNVLINYVEEIIQSKNYVTLETITEYVLSKINSDIGHLTQKDKTIILTKILLNNDLFKDILFLFYTIPQRLGGMGVDFLLNHLLSGHSVGLAKQMSLIFEYINKFSTNSSELFGIINAICLGEKNDSKQIEDSAFLIYQYPTRVSFPLASRYIAKECYKSMESLNNNKDIREYIRLANNSEGLGEKLLDIFLQKYEHRIASFYLEHSSNYFREMLTKKFDETTALLNKRYQLKRLRYQLIRNRGRQNKEIMTLITNSMKGSDNRLLEYRYNSTDFLMQVRRYLASSSQLQFLDMPEPQYDGLIEEIDENNYHFAVSSNLFRSLGVTTLPYATLLFSDEVKFKGIFEEEMLSFNNVKVYLIHKLITNTLFIIRASQKAGHKLQESNLLLCNVVVACDSALSTFTGDRFLDSYQSYRTIIGGEVLHRLQNMAFKTESYARSLPNTIRMFSSHINSQQIDRDNLTDTNDNYDYVRIKLHIQATLLYIEDKMTVPTRKYRLRPSMSRKRVDVDFLYDYKKGQFDPKEKKIDKLYSTKYIKISRFLALSDVKFPLSEIVDKDFDFKDDDYDFKQVHCKILDDATKQISMMISKGIIPSAFLLTDTSLESIMSELMNRHYFVYFDTLNAERPTSQYLALKFRERISRYNESHIKSNQENQHYNILDNLCMTKISNLSTELGEDECSTVIADLRNVQLVSRTKKKDVFYEKLTDRVKNSKYYIYKLTYFIARYFNVFFIHEGKMQTQLTGLQDHIKIIEKNRHLIYIKDKTDKIEFQRLGAYLMAGVYAVHGEEINELINSICDEVNRLVEIQEVKEQMQYKWKNVLEMKCDTTFPKEYDSILTECPSELITNEKVRNSIFRYVKRVSLLSSNITVFSSPTGSDAYVPQRGLFQKMLESNLLTLNNKVLDLTAGRGDGHIALSELRLNHLSVTRNDIFTDLYCSPDVLLLRNYDVYDLKTWAFGYEYDHAHLDISFTSESSGKILNLVKVMLSMGKSMTIRLNSIRGDISQILKICEEKKSFIRLFLPSKNSTMHYHTYLYLSKPQESEQSNKVNFKDSELMKWILHSLKRRITRYELVSNTQYEVTSSYNVGVMQEIESLIKKDLLDTKIDSIANHMEIKRMITILNFHLTSKRMLYLRDKNLGIDFTRIKPLKLLDLLRRLPDKSNESFIEIIAIIPPFLKATFFRLIYYHHGLLQHCLEHGLGKLEELDEKYRQTQALKNDVGPECLKWLLYAVRFSNYKKVLLFLYSEALKTDSEKSRPMQLYLMFRHSYNIYTNMGRFDNIEVKLLRSVEEECGAVINDKVNVVKLRNLTRTDFIHRVKHHQKKQKFKKPEVLQAISDTPEDFFAPNMLESILACMENSKGSLTSIAATQSSGLLDWGLADQVINCSEVGVFQNFLFSMIPTEGKSTEMPTDPEEYKKLLLEAYQDLGDEFVSYADQMEEEWYEEEEERQLLGQSSE